MKDHDEPEYKDFVPIDPDELFDEGECEFCGEFLDEWGYCPKCDYDDEDDDDEDVIDDEDLENLDFEVEDDN